MIQNVCRPAWQRWQLIAQANGDLIARLTVVAFYYTFFKVFAIPARRFADPRAGYFLNPTVKSALVSVFESQEDMQ